MPRILRLCLLLGLGAAALGAAEPVLTLTAPGRSIVLTAAEFAALPRAEAVVTDPHRGVPRRFSGVPVGALLARLDAPLGERLRGPALALAVVARSADGYTVVFSLAEFDAAFSSRTIILADREDDRPLALSAAPFQVITPGDKRGARWARGVVALELVSLAAP